MARHRNGGDRVGASDRAVGDPGRPAAVIARRIYRTKATSPDTTDYYLVGTITDNSSTTFSDNIADAALGAAVNSASSNRGYLAAAGDAFARFNTTSSSFGLLNAGLREMPTSPSAITRWNSAPTAGELPRSASMRFGT